MAKSKDADTDSSDEKESYTILMHGRFRTVLPQVISAVVTSFLLFDVGASNFYATIIIPALTGLNTKNNPDEIIEMTAAEASWFGSTAYLLKLLGGLLCGWISDPIGRKKAMILVNLPVFLSWYFFYYSTSSIELFFANGLLGFASGFLKVPCITYVGEVTQPSIRGTLVSSSTVSTALAPLLIFLLGTLTTWRDVALYACGLQLLTFIALFFIPESPIWLMTKNREAEALKSLKWLRGWKVDDNVQAEFEDLQRYKEYSNTCTACRKANAICSHSPPTLANNFHELMRRKTLKPFVIYTTCGFFAYTCGSHHLMTYVVQIMHTYHSPIDANWATVIIGFVAFISMCIGVVFIKLMGKRKFYLISLGGMVVSMVALVVYGYLYLPPNIKSYESTENDGDTKITSVIPLTLFCILRFFTVGTILVILSMLAELFPLKIRNIAGGLTVGVVNMQVFFAIKFFYNIEHWTSLPGAFAIYAVMGLIGLVITYLIIPETEGRSLEEIELHFSNNKLGFFDRKIQPIHDSSGRASKASKE